MRPFQGTEGKWKVSTAKGGSPTWSAARNELFYMELGGKHAIMMAPYTADGDSFSAEKPRLWSPNRIMPLNANPYDLHPDGRRVVMMKRPEHSLEQRDKVVFVFNFFDELRRVAPAATR